MAQRVGFEPTGRFLADQTISSRSRYDRFDTAACLIVRSELKKAARKKERIHGEKSPRNASAAYPESLEKSSIFERSLPIRGLDFECCPPNGLEWKMREYSGLYGTQKRGLKGS